MTLWNEYRRTALLLGNNILLAACMVRFLGCSAEERSSSSTAEHRTVPVYGFEITGTFRHDTSAFTQGLQFQGGSLFESTGLRGQSSLRRVDPETGRVQQRVNLPDRYFGEGIALISNRIYMLTWQEETGFVFDRDTLTVIDRFSYEGEGWGLAYDGHRLIMSDGTDTLRFLDPETLEVTGTQSITVADEPLRNINELAWIEGELWANIFPTHRIARIDVDNGTVVAWIDLTGILRRDQITGRIDVLNGIAYDEETQRIFVTGKLWPLLFTIRLVPPLADG